MDEQRCFSCGSRDLERFYEVGDIPVHNVMMFPSERAALDYPRGDLSLVFCHRCGFIQNERFDGSVHDYSTKCEESQAFSGTFNAFAEELARRWIDRYDLRGKTVLEVGCGKGDFLALLCRLGPNRGIGIDPGLVPERIPADVADRIECIVDFYREEHESIDADFVTCRHTLEHVQDTRAFVRRIRDAAARRPGTIVTFELPDVGRVLRETAFWDIYYEHCSYFSLGSLGRLFRSLGFEILDLSKDYGDQYLLIDARISPEGERGDPPSFEGEDDLDDLRRDVAAFRQAAARSIEAWRRFFGEARDRGEKAVLWGSGSKAVSFLTTLGIREEIAGITDINPHRQGRHIPGTGHEVLPPERLRAIRPEHVVIMNAIYEDEIRRDLASMGLSPAIRALH